MINRLVEVGLVAVVLFLAGTVEANQNPYLEIYQKSIQRMGAPDILGDIAPDATASELRLAVLLASGTSKTCSQRCSTTCSNSCTTTRGCSSQCKVQTDGCGGGGTPVRPPATPTPPGKIRPVDPPPDPQDPAQTGGAKPPSPSLEPFLGEVTGVVEGDILSVRQTSTLQVKIRLAQVDAPEIGQPYGAEAMKALSDKIQGKTVSVKPILADDQGRSIALVYVGTRWINKEMVEEGMAWYFKDHAPSAILAQAEGKARESKIGLWAAANPVPPWEYRRALAAKAAQRDAQPVQPGDTVRVEVGPAPVQIGTQVLATVDAGTTLVAQKCEGEWVSVTIQKDGKQVSGWIAARRLVRVAGPTEKPRGDGVAPTY